MGVATASVALATTCHGLHCADRGRPSYRFELILILRSFHGPGGMELPTRMLFCRDCRDQVTTAEILKGSYLEYAAKFFARQMRVPMDRTRTEMKFKRLFKP